MNISSNGKQNQPHLNNVQTSQRKLQKINIQSQQFQYNVLKHKCRISLKQYKKLENQFFQISSHHMKLDQSDPEMKQRPLLFKTKFNSIKDFTVKKQHLTEQLVESILQNKHKNDCNKLYIEDNPNKCGQQQIVLSQYQLSDDQQQQYIEQQFNSVMSRLKK